MDVPDFPLTGTLREQYDYTGADAAVRVEARTERLTPGAGGASVTNKVTWTAASKPFGTLEDEQPPHRLGLVLPAFHEVRLFPVDASSAPSGGGYNIEWRRHIELHLPQYMVEGPDPGSSCWFCQQLVTWEDPMFRQEGVTWLATNSYRCTIHGGGGGPHHGGGSVHAH
jgi:hypothetical protein